MSGVKPVAVESMKEARAMVCSKENQRGEAH